AVGDGALGLGLLLGLVTAGVVVDQLAVGADLLQRLGELGSILGLVARGIGGREQQGDGRIGRAGGLRAGRRRGRRAGWLGGRRRLRRGGGSRTAAARRQQQRGDGCRP